MTERLLHFSAVLGLGAGLAVLLIEPNVALFGWGHGLLPGTMHLFTVGGVIGAGYALLQRLWIHLYGAQAQWRPLLWAASLLHVAGWVLLVWGFFFQSTALAYWGGHYGVPTGILIFGIHGIVATRRREAGQGRWAVSHLPVLGLFVAASIGALLVMDAHTVAYGIYGPGTILAHLLAAGFLFVLPLMLLPDALAATGAIGNRAGDRAVGGTLAGTDHGGDRLALLRWYGMVVSAATGVLFAVLGLLPPDSPLGAPRLLGVGLTMLGALLIWLGLPSRHQGSVARPPLSTLLLERGALLATGVLLLYAAMRMAAGIPGEGLWLAKILVPLFGLGVAAPALLTHLERLAGLRGSWLRQGLWLTGSALLLAGQLWASPTLLRLGVLVWLVGLGLHKLLVLVAWLGRK